MSHFYGVNPMEKRKWKKYVESENETLTYMQKVGKNDFLPTDTKSDPSPKGYQTKRKCIIKSNKELRIRTKWFQIHEKRQRGSKKWKKNAKKVYK